ncbi:MAG: transglutaminase domain-containing protein [Polyangiaceae bacterium]
MAIVIFDNDYSPPAQAYYFREDALSQFTGARLVAASRGDVDTDIVLTHPTEPTPVRGAPSPAGRVKVRARVAMLTEHSRPFGLETPTEFSPMPNPNRQRFVRAYRFEALAQSAGYRTLLGKAPGDPAWTKDVVDYYTAGPSDPRYGELARKLVAQLPPVRQADPFAKALAITLHLNKELSYSTKERHAGAADPTADMLFGNKIGYCVHFAHAAVYLWRSVGVPARVAVGYRTEEDARAGGSALLVRSGDAHAWPELYLAGIGWIVLDVAAEKNLDPPAPPQDEDLQRLLGEMARSDPPDPKEPPRLRRPPMRNWGRDIGLAGLLLVVGAAVALYLIKIWRRVVPIVAGQRSIGRVGYRYALDLLAEAGLSRDFGETREAFARRAGNLAPSFSAVTDMHLAARWRGPDVAPADRPERSRAAWRKALRALRADLGRRGKLVRRLLGLVNPASIFDAR